MPSISKSYYYPSLKQNLPIVLLGLGKQVIPDHGTYHQKCSIMANIPHQCWLGPAVIHYRKEEVQLGSDKNKARRRKWGLLAGGPDVDCHIIYHYSTSPFPQLTPRTYGELLYDQLTEKGNNEI